MKSNSKLSKEQKIDLAQFKKANKNVHFYCFERVTIAIEVLRSGNGRIAWSIASLSEIKFRRKVGEYHAVLRMRDAFYLPIELNYNQKDIDTRQDTLYDKAFEIASIIQGDY